MELETEFELKQEEMALDIEEGETQAVRMEEKVKEGIGLTNKRVNKVNRGLEVYHTCVDAMVQRREEELEFCKCQGGGLVQNLETHATEQEQVLVDKGLWEP